MVSMLDRKNGNCFQQRAPLRQFKGPEPRLMLCVMEEGRGEALDVLANADADHDMGTLVKKAPAWKLSPSDLQFQDLGPPQDSPPSLMRLVTCLEPL